MQRAGKTWRASRLQEPTGASRVGDAACAGLGCRHAPRAPCPPRLFCSGCVPRRNPGESAPCPGTRGRARLGRTSAEDSSRRARSCCSFAAASICGTSLRHCRRARHFISGAACGSAVDSPTTEGAQLTVKGSRGVDGNVFSRGGLHAASVRHVFRGHLASPWSGPWAQFSTRGVACPCRLADYHATLCSLPPGSSRFFPGIRIGRSANRRLRLITDPSWMTSKVSRRRAD